MHCGKPGFDSWVRKIPWRRDRLPTPVFRSGEFHGLYSPWVCKVSDTTEWLSLSHTSKVNLKILQARLLQYVNFELPNVQAGFRKGRGTRDQIANIHWIIEKARVPEKHLFLLYWLCQNLWLCGSQQTGKFLKWWEHHTTWPASWEICMHVKKQQLELDM